MELFHTEFFEVGKSPYIIAEIGLNHNGSLDLAKRMIDSAAENGARCAKFQIFRSECFIHKEAKLGSGSLQEFFKQFELSDEEWIKLAEHARETGIDFAAAVFDDPSIALYPSLHPSFVKIASGDINNSILVEKLKKLNLPFIFSTGTAEQSEVDRMVRWLHGFKKAVLLCVSSYPARPGDYQLPVIPQWKELYQCPAGISDHCSNPVLSIASVAIGSSIIERHFTTDRSLPGPDQKLSDEPHDLRRVVIESHIVYESLQSVKKCQESEKGVKKGARRALYAKRDILPGDPFRLDDWIDLRPSGGFDISEVELLSNKKAAISISEGSILSAGMFV